MNVQQFSSYCTWYNPGGGKTPAQKAMEGGVQDKKGRPAYTLEQYLAGQAPYVCVAMDRNAFPYGTLIYCGKFKDTNGNLIPFRVNDTGGLFLNAGLEKIDIATSSFNLASNGPNFYAIWQVAGASNIIPSPTPDSPGVLPDPNGCEGLNNPELASPRTFNDLNNSPGGAFGAPLSPNSLGGSGVGSDYIPQELKRYGNGNLPLSILTPLTFAPNHRLYGPAATAFEKLVADYKGTGRVFPGVTDSYRTLAIQRKLKAEKPRLAAQPGKSMHGWGLAIDFNNGDRRIFEPFLAFLKTQAYNYSIYGLAANTGDKFYSNGFWRGEEWHWEFRGGSSPQQQNPIAANIQGGSQKDYYDSVYQAVYNAAVAKGLPYPDVIAQLGASQSSLETGYGRSTPPGSNNVFGIKGRGPAGTVVTPTNEATASGGMIRINQPFRRYNNVGESAVDYVDFLIQNGRYKNVLASSTFERAALAVWNAKYAGESRTYGPTVISIGRRLGRPGLIASR